MRQPRGGSSINEAAKKVAAALLICLSATMGPAFVDEHPAAAQAHPGGGGVAASAARPAAPTFEGAANMSESEMAEIATSVGLLRDDFPPGRSISDSVGLAIYDRKRRKILKSFNLDKSFNLASTTKLFTMAVVGQTFRNPPLRAQDRDHLAWILRESDNRGASLWLLLAEDRAKGRPLDRNRTIGNCHWKPRREAAQRAAERKAAETFFAAHRARYRIDWRNSQIVDGAGCERAGVRSGGEDRMTPRQFLSVLDALSTQRFGDWNAFELMPKLSAEGTVIEQKLDLPEAVKQGVVAWKTGTDKEGIRNIAGFIPKDGDPFAFYYAIFVNTGKSPPNDTGLIRGKDVVYGFAAWAGQVARRQ